MWWQTVRTFDNPARRFSRNAPTEDPTSSAEGRSSPPWRYRAGRQWKGAPYRYSAARAESDRGAGEVTSRDWWLILYMYDILMGGLIRGGRMATVPPISTNGHIDLTEEEAAALFDREARRYLGMSGQEFITAWESGKFDENPDQSDVMYVAMLLPLVQ